MICQPATCTDGVQNENETDVDCGGVCPPCANGKMCGTGTDPGANCTNKICTNGICQAATCTDGVQNGNETDVDCGGGTCPPCNPGQKCDVGGDCVGDNCDITCQCPMNMLPAPIIGGGIYCIDQVEVTYGEYDVFYSANPTTAGAGQSPECQWNQGWTPYGAWPYLPQNVDVPVTYVNWCQAQKYCAYSGKRLCGKIGGGSVALTSFNDATLDQWYSACSSEGVNCEGTSGGCYPYGGPYQAGVCNGDDPGGGPGSWTNLLSCVGGVPGVYNMSGNVAEWEDSCSATAGAGDTCAVRGGSYQDGASALRCDSGGGASPPTEERNYAGPDVGFRCCL